MLSITLILAAFFVAVKTIREKIVAGSFLLISFIDIAHYWMFYKRSEYVLGLEFIIILIAAVLIGFKYKANAPTN